MCKRFTSRIACGGYGSIILTITVFFAQGGFADMNWWSILYIFGLLIGTGLILYSVLRVDNNDSKQKHNNQCSEAKRRLILLEQLLGLIEIEFERLRNVAIEYPLKDYEDNYLLPISDYNNFKNRCDDTCDYNSIILDRSSECGN
jgi:hypothetical protein